MDSPSGGAKKFLYAGPKKGDEDDNDDLPWNFNSKKPSNTGGGASSKFDLNDVWSIQRNVNIGGVPKQPKAEALHYNTNKNYYSRHGGTSKDKDEFTASLGSSTARNDNFGNTDASGKTWTSGNQTSRRPFSYAFGNSGQNENEVPVSPRIVSNSSSGVYPQTGSSHFSLQTGSGLNSGNVSSYKGGNTNSQSSGTFFSSQGTDKFGYTNSNSVSNRSSMPISNGLGHVHNTSSRNGLFQTSSTQRTPSQNGLFNVNTRSSFDGASPGRQNKSFW